MCLCPDLLRSYRYPGSVCVQTASANIATLAVSAYRPPILTTLPWQRLCPDLLRPVCVNDTIATAYIADCSVVIAAPIRFKVERLEEIAKMDVSVSRPPVLVSLPWQCLRTDRQC